MDILAFLATSQRIEIERSFATIKAQKGQHGEATECLRRLAQEAQDAAAVLAGLRTDGGDGDDLFSSVDGMLAQQLVLIATQLADVEQEAAKQLIAAPTPPHTTAGYPTNQRRAGYKKWPTADPNYSRPALEPVFFKEYQGGTVPRVPGDMAGAVHLRRQLDEQENRIEAAKVAAWLDDIGRGPSAAEAEGRGRKRPGDDNLISPPNKRHHESDPSNTENRLGKTPDTGEESPEGIISTDFLKSEFGRGKIYERPGRYAASSQPSSPTSREPRTASSPRTSASDGNRGGSSRTYSSP